MSSNPLQWVVDASVGIKLFVPERLSDRSEALFDLLGAERPAELYVPDLFYIECASILWKHVRRFGYSEADAQEDLMSLRLLALRRIPTWELVESALDIALEHSITAYDACYVALAKKIAAPLVTDDEKLVHKLAGGPFNVLWLGALDIPRTNPP